MNTTADSVTQWIQRSQTGSDSAVTKLWDRYYDELLIVSRQRLKGNANGINDAEDLAIVVLASFFTGLRSGRIKTVINRDHLWHLLEKIAGHQSIDMLRRGSAIKRTATGLANVGLPDLVLPQTLSNLPEPAAIDPAPGWAAELEDELQHLLCRLPTEDLRQIVRDKLDGFTNPEISQRLGKSVSSIERKMKRIKAIWLLED